jgi:hypothetical protein
MKKNDVPRPFLEKVANDNREYVQSLLDENQRLGKLTAQLEIERDHAQRSLANALAELDSRATLETQLEQRLRTIEAESRVFSQRYVEVEQQNTNLANLYVASYQLNGTLDREGIVAAIQEIVINLIGSEELAIWELDDELEALSLIGSFGVSQREWAGVPLGSGVVGHVAESGERFVAGEMLVAPSGREEHLTACIPLKLDEKVVGVIGIFRLLQQKHGLEPIDFELFDLLGSHAASALFCTRLYERYAEALQ